ncbi:hypothetical protein MTO96_019717 [Rhipicephalus appendiculatus]
MTSEEMSAATLAVGGNFYSCVLLAVASGVAATVVVAPAVATTIHHAPAVSKATRVVSYQSAYPGVPHTVAKVSSYTPAATAVHTVHASVPAAVVHHAPAYAVHAAVPATFYSCVLLAVASGVSCSWPEGTKKVYTTSVLAAPAVATTLHHAPAVSKATRVVSYQSAYPGVPHTVAKVSSYTPAATAVHTVHASVPAAVVHHAPAYAVHAAVPATVAGVVHHAPSYTYGSYPAGYSYGHRYDYHPVRYAYGVTH